MKSLIKSVAVLGLVLACCTLVGLASPPDHPSKNKIELNVSAYDDAAMLVSPMVFNSNVYDEPVNSQAIVKFVLTGYGFAPVKAEKYRPPGNDIKPDNTLINGILSEHRSSLLMSLAAYD